MKTLFALLVLSVFSALARADSPEALIRHNCYREHISDSLKTNLKKKKDFQVLGDKAAVSFLNDLIFWERLTLATTPYYDLKARQYQNAGIPIFCEEFRPLVLTETKVHPSAIPDQTYTDFDVKAFQKKLNPLLKAHDYDAAKQLLLSTWYELNREPAYHCMFRHFVESVYRFLIFLPERVSAAKAQDLKDPTELILFAIQGQTLSFSLMNRLDQKAYSVQKTGIPLVCEELPNLMGDLPH